MEHAVVVDNVTKKYGAVEALKGVSLTVSSGELFGIIGPDGAGKTSLFRILTTLLLPDSGNASVCGLDIAKDYKEIRRRVGTLLPLSGLDGRRKPELLCYCFPYHH